MSGPLYCCVVVVAVVQYLASRDQLQSFARVCGVHKPLPSPDAFANLRASKTTAKGSGAKEGTASGGTFSQSKRDRHGAMSHVSPDTGIASTHTTPDRTRQPKSRRHLVGSSAQHGPGARPVMSFQAPASDNLLGGVSLSGELSSLVDWALEADGVSFEYNAESSSQLDGLRPGEPAPGTADAVGGDCVRN
jgi:hypothetical protein